MWGCWSARWALRGARNERQASEERAADVRGGRQAVSRVRRGGQPWRWRLQGGRGAAGGWGRDLRLASAPCASASPLPLRAVASGAVPCPPCRPSRRARVCPRLPASPSSGRGCPPAFILPAAALPPPSPLGMPVPAAVRVRAVRPGCHVPSPAARCSGQRGGRAQEAEARLARAPSRQPRPDRLGAATATADRRDRHR